MIAQRAIQLKRDCSRGMCSMANLAKQSPEQENFTFGRAFMGFLMGVGAIIGIWLLSGVLMLVKVFG